MVASGWALQAAALPAPKPAAHVAADASVWFEHYRLAVDVFHFDHHRSNGACARSWFARQGEPKVRGSVLSFAGGPILRVSGKKQVLVVKARRRRRFPPGLLAADVGCTHLLARRLAAAAQGATHITTERAYAANRPAVALEVQRGREERLTLYISPRTDRPLVAFLARRDRHITARIYLQPVRRAVLRRFGLLRRIKPEPKR